MTSLRTSAWEAIGKEVVLVVPFGGLKTVLVLF